MPTEKHLHAIKRIFRYLKGTIHLGVWYSKDTGISLTTYLDADHARCQDTRRSTSGSAQFLGASGEWSSGTILCQERLSISRHLHQSISMRKIQLLDRKARTMNTPAQQTTLDNALVSPDDRVRIGKCNMRIIPTMTQKEPTCKVVLDALALTPCYPAFLITAEFKLDKKKCKVDVEVFHDILQICPRLPNQEFVKPTSSDEEIVSFFKELGYKGDIELVTEVYIDHMHQPWRTFVAIINRPLSGKTTGLDKIRLSRAQIMWGDDQQLLIKRGNKRNLLLLQRRKLLLLLNSLQRNMPRNMLLEDSQLVFKSETLLVRLCGSNEGAGLEPKVLDEQKGKSIDIHERTSLKPGVPDVSKADSSKNDEEETQEDEFVHTPKDYVPTDDETNNVDDEDYIKIKEEMYDDVIVELKDVELVDEGKDDKEINDAEKVNAEHEEVIHEDASTQVQNEAQVTTTAAPAQVGSSSRSVSSNYGSIFLNLDNISSIETEIISMLDVLIQHENLNIHSSSLLTVPVSVIPEPISLSSIHETLTIATATTTSSPIHPFIPHPQKSTQISTPTTTEATTSTPAIQESKTLFAIHLRVLDLEKKVKELKNVDHSSALLAIIKSEVLTAVKEYLGTSLDDALHKVLQRHIAKFIKEHSVLADVVKVLKQQQKPHKSIEDICKVKMEHAAKQQESQYTIISSDKAALKEFDQKRTLDEDPPVGPDQGLKRKKMSKDVKPSKKAKLTDTSKGTTKSQPKSTGKSAQAKANPKDWFKKPKRPPTPDPEWNTRKTVNDGPTQN
ncbi:hypothetical protein Tco_0467951 [Tanacetum coccineum]